MTLSKSLSGYGLPFALVLIRPDLDQWRPGEHNGTFRGNNLAFITAKAAIDHYWSDDKFSNDIKRKGDYINKRLESIVARYGEGNFTTRGRGMFRGLNCVSGELAEKITRLCFKKGLIIETSGADDHVVKTLCSLTISDENLKKGLDIIEESVRVVLDQVDSVPEEEDFFSDDWEAPIKLIASYPWKPSAPLTLYVLTRNQKGNKTMIVRSLQEAEKGDRKIYSDGWDSTRLALKNDNMGFSFHITTIYKDTELHFHYQNHLEAVYCISGKGSVEDLATGEVHPITPGTIYLLDKHDKHILRGEEEMKMACVFNPPLHGKEVHNAEGAYELDAEEVK